MAANLGTRDQQSRLSLRESTPVRERRLSPEVILPAFLNTPVLTPSTFSSLTVRDEVHIGKHKLV